MDKAFARITMGNLVFVLYWNDILKQAEVYDTSRGGFEHIDAITKGKEHPFDLVQAVIDYGERLELTIDEIAI